MMSPWVQIGVTTGIAIIGIAVQFYMRLVPAETQRWHFKWLWKWVRIVFKIAVLSSFLLSLFGFLRSSAPIKPSTVVGIAWDASGFVGLGILFLLDALMNVNARMSAIQGRQIDVQEKHLEFLERHLAIQKEALEYSVANRKAILLLASVLHGVTPELESELRNLLPVPKDKSTDEISVQ